MPPKFLRLTMLLGLATTNLFAHAADFTVSTSSQVDGRFPLAQFGKILDCSGDNLSPEIAWHNAPPGTKSFVITMYDPDAPTGSGWWHWVVANIPADVTALKEGASSQESAMPAGAVQIRGDNGLAGYAGLCPPVGTPHNYVLTVHALKVDKLDLPPTVTPAMLGFMTLRTGLAKATLTIKGSR